METYIDDVAGEWAVDIKGEPIQLGSNNGWNGVHPDDSVRASDVTIYHMTLLGHILSVAGLLTSQKKGVHYVPVGTIPYRPTPKNFFSGQEEAKTGSRKMYKQKPLRIRY